MIFLGEFVIEDCADEVHHRTGSLRGVWLVLSTQMKNLSEGAGQGKDTVAGQG